MCVLVISRPITCEDHISKTSYVAANAAAPGAAITARSNEPAALMQADELRALLGGVNDMWLWRRLQDRTLPKPLLISHRRFWRRDEIADYINRQSQARNLTGEAA